MTDSQNDHCKKWWAPVWTGLVMDPQARHYHGMRNALWLFLYLLLNANRKTGFLLRKVQTISDDTGIQRETVLRWLTLLRNQGYITTQSNGRCLHIQINKWKDIENTAKMPSQKLENADTRSDNHDTSKAASKEPFSVHFGPESRNWMDANDRTINKYILNNDIDSLKHGASEGLDKKQLLALELADALEDRKGLALYRAYAERYPEALLRRAFSEAKAMPSERIKKSRAALFNHLVQKHVRETLQDSGR